MVLGANRVYHDVLNAIAIGSETKTKNEMNSSHSYVNCEVIDLDFIRYKHHNNDNQTNEEEAPIKNSRCIILFRCLHS